MTDNEIVKAKQTLNLMCQDITNLTMLEALAMAINSFDEINRQKAEIERLNKEVDRLSQLVLYHDVNIADAIKEFAERLKKELSFGKYIQPDQIDNLVKEMVGDVGCVNTQ